jgi:putative flippase GtrA
MMRGFADVFHSPRLRKELWSLVKFGVVGGTSFLLNIALYTAISRWVWPAGPRTAQALIAVLLASVYNFLLHGLWTFEAGALRWHAVVRYVVVALGGNVLYTGLFYIGYHLFHLFDILVVAGSSICVGCFTYASHRWFTFHPSRSSAVGSGAQS